MGNLKRYGPSVTASGFGTMQRLDNGGWVKFSDIKELLQTAHNSAMVPCSKCGSDSPIVSYCVNCIPKLKVASAQHH